MDKQELLELKPMEAQRELDDEQLERYNNLKEDNLKEDLKEKQADDNQNAVDGLAAMRQQAENKLTVEVYGVEFIADLGPKQFHKLNKAAKFEDKKVDSLDQEQITEIRSNILDVLAELDRENNREDWQENFGDAGIVTLGSITGELLDEIETYMEQKKSR